MLSIKVTYPISTKNNLKGISFGNSFNNLNLSDGQKNNENKNYCSVIREVHLSIIIKDFRRLKKLFGNVEQ
tara:strand:- start:839 stop:1051 length:213 start_codon:yes stop_codon:yes gene_type:complete